MIDYFRLKNIKWCQTHPCQNIEIQFKYISRPQGKRLLAVLKDKQQILPLLHLKLSPVYVVRLQN